MDEQADGCESTPHTAHGEAQRRALVRAAYDLIAEDGLEGLRTRKVADRAKVNVATLHYYFKSKEDLIRGVVGLLREQLIFLFSLFFLFFFFICLFLFLVCFFFSSLFFFFLSSSLVFSLLS